MIHVAPSVQTAYTVLVGKLKWINYKFSHHSCELPHNFSQSERDIITTNAPWDRTQNLTCGR